MALILAAVDNDDGTTTVTIDGGVTVQIVTVMPTARYLLGDAEQVADAAVTSRLRDIATLTGEGTS